MISVLRPALVPKDVQHCPWGVDVKVLIFHPSADQYGSDLQILEAARGLVGHGDTVTFVLPSGGDLAVEMLRLGMSVVYLDFPVLRRQATKLLPLAALMVGFLWTVPAMVGLIRRHRPDVIMVNTITIPGCLLAARLAGTPSVCYVHEAERHERFVVRLVLYLPLMLANGIIAISNAAATAIDATVSRLSSKVTIINNGIPDRAPEFPPALAAPFDSRPLRVGAIARISHRKGTDVCLETVSHLVSKGVDAHLHLFGTVFPGNEEYLDRLKRRASDPDIVGRVHFEGYRRPVWPAFDEVDVVVAASRIEPAGNSVVEAQYSLRPVVASQALGHMESIVDGRTGILVPIDDPTATAEAILRVMSDPVARAELATNARLFAVSRCSIERYNRDIRSKLTSVLRA